MCWFIVQMQAVEEERKESEESSEEGPTMGGWVDGWMLDGSLFGGGAIQQFNFGWKEQGFIEIIHRKLQGIVYHYCYKEVLGCTSLHTLPALRSLLSVTSRWGRPLFSSSL